MGGASQIIARLVHISHEPQRHRSRFAIAIGWPRTAAARTARWGSVSMVTRSEWRPWRGRLRSSRESRRRDRSPAGRGYPMPGLINGDVPAGLSSDQAGRGDSRLIFGAPYQAGDRTVIPVAELIEGAGPSDGAARGLIQERSLGLIEIAGDTADYRPITSYRRSAIIGAIVLALVAIAALRQSRIRTRR